MGGDLIVARGGGVQALAGLSDETDQPALDVEVHVLGLQRPAEPSRLDFAGDPGQAALDRPEIRRRQDSRDTEHAKSTRLHSSHRPSAEAALGSREKPARQPYCTLTSLQISH